LLHAYLKFLLQVLKIKGETSPIGGKIGKQWFSSSFLDQPPGLRCLGQAWWYTTVIQSLGGKEG
jgi:hypothetical protein